MKPDTTSQRTVPSPIPNAAQPAAPVAAADTDLIEDEWVDLVKRILIENRADPYSLSKAITILRADYMKKRYSKEIKLAD